MSYLKVRFGAIVTVMQLRIDRSRHLYWKRYIVVAWPSSFLLFLWWWYVLGLVNRVWCGQRAERNVHGTIGRVLIYDRHIALARDSRWLRGQRSRNYEQFVVVKTFYHVYLTEVDDYMDLNRWLKWLKLKINHYILMMVSI